jgi:hypothetical protein
MSKLYRSTDVHILLALPSKHGQQIELDYMNIAVNLGALALSDQNLA